MLDEILANPRSQTKKKIVNYLYLNQEFRKGFPCSTTRLTGMDIAIPADVACSIAP